MRAGGRAADELRPIRITRGYTRHAEGSVLVQLRRHARAVHGQRRREGARLPARQGRGLGHRRVRHAPARRPPLARAKPRAASRAVARLEIQRLIGRALRACSIRKALGERTITLDCDVLQADGGTRTAAITGAYVALVDAVRWLQSRKLIAATRCSARSRQSPSGMVAACRYSISITPRTATATPT